MLSLTVILALLHGASTARIRQQSQHMLSRQVKLLHARSNTSSSMWDGKNVELTDVSDKQIPHLSKTTPVPGFVSFVSECDLSGGQYSVQQCGGILYKKKYVITAAHCLREFGKCSIKAYVNPYRSAFVKQMVDGQTYKFASQKEFLQAFQEDADKDGLGITLPNIKAVFQHQGWLAEYAKIGEKAPDDIGIVQLEEMVPFPADSLAWELLEQTPFIDSSHATAGTLYGFGDSKEYCAGMRDVSCFLQEKKVRLLPYEDCMKLEVEIAHHTIEKIISHMQENNVLSKLGKHAEPALQLSQKLGKALSDRSQLWKTYWDSHEPGDNASTDEFAEVQSRADVFSNEAKDAVLKIQEIIPSPTLQVFALHDVREGKQLCVYSPTGAQREGDSGGPLLDESGKLIGVSSWAQSANGPLEYKSPHWTERGGPFDSEMMPGFYMSAQAYKTEIDDLLKCLVLESLEGNSGDSKCKLGTAPPTFPMLANLIDKGRAYLSSIGK